MSIPVRTLLVEDSDSDAELLLRALRAEGFEPRFERVQTAAKLRGALAAGDWDVILCDNSMPGFNAMAALRLVRESGFELPFIFISGTLSEEEAVTAMKQGAIDFLPKGRLSRLGAAVRLALELSRLRRAHKQLEAALRESESRLRSFTENMPALIFMKDASGRYLHVNRRFEQQFQLSKDQVIGKTDFELFTREQASVFQANDRRVLESEKSMEFEETAHYFDGPHTSIVSKFLLRDAAGLITGLCGVATDISERKRIEEALRMAQETVQTIFDSAPVAILGLDLQGRITKWNAGAARMFGWTESEVLGRVCPTVPEDGRDDFFAMILRVSQQGPQTGMVYPRKKQNGQRIQTSISAAPLRSAIGVVTGVMVILEDVTTRLQSEAALQRAESEQRQIAEQLAEERGRLLAAQAVAKVGSWETELPTGTVTWSDETHRIFGTDPAHFLPTHHAFLQLVHPDDRAKVDRAFENSLARREPSTIEHRIQLRDGRDKIVEERWQLFFNEQGQPIRAVGTCQDITDRKRTEKAQRESEERFRTIFEHAGIGIALVGPTDGRILRCNRAMAELLGYTLEEMAELTVQAVSVPEDYDDDRAQWGRMLSGEIVRFQMEKRYLRKDGKIVWGLLTSTLVRDAEQRPLFIIGMVEAINERKLAETELRAAEQQLHALVERLNRVREEEAKRIARELHDDLGQRLTALNMELGHLEGRLPTMAPGERHQLARMRAMVDHTIEVVQKISSELRIGQLDVLGLTAAIDWHLKEFTRRSAIPCRALRLDEVANLSDAQSTAVFRILQEALTNVVRHAGATAVDVSLVAGPDQLTLQVHDNGRGIREKEIMNRNAIGLLGMRERAQIVGGRVSITGGAGVGTTVVVTIPLSGAGTFPA